MGEELIRKLREAFRRGWEEGGQQPFTQPHPLRREPLLPSKPSPLVPPKGEWWQILPQRKLPDDTQQAIDAELNWYEKLERFAPPTIVGSFYQKHWAAGEKAIKEWEVEHGRKFTREDYNDPDIRADLVIRAQKIVEKEIHKQPLHEVFLGAPSVEQYKEYERLPWYKQLLWEAPFWGAISLLSGAVGGASGLSEQLAPIAARGGVRGRAASALIRALKPGVIYEQVVSKAIAKIQEPIFRRGFEKYPAWEMTKKIFPPDSPQYPVLRQRLLQAYMAERMGNYELAQQIRMNIWREWGAYIARQPGEIIPAVFNQLQTTTLPTISPPEQPLFPITREMWEAIGKGEREIILSFLELPTGEAALSWAALPMATKAALSGGTSPYEGEVYPVKPVFIPPRYPREYIERIIGRELKLGEYEAIHRELFSHGYDLMATLRAMGYIADEEAGAIPPPIPPATEPAAGAPLEDRGRSALAVYLTMRQMVEATKQALKAPGLSEGDKAILEASLRAGEQQLRLQETELERLGVAIPETPLEIPRAEPGMPEAGIQSSMLPEEVPSREVFPKGRGVPVQERMDDYLKLLELERAEAEETARQAQMEAEAMREVLETDKLASMRFNIPYQRTIEHADGTTEIVTGTRAVGIDYFIDIREGTFPDTFTARQASLLTGDPEVNFAHYRNKVPREVALADIERQTGLSMDEIAEQAMRIRAMKRRIRELEKMAASAKQPDMTPETITQKNVPPLPEKPSLLEEVSQNLADIKVEIEAAREALRTLRGAEAKLARKVMKQLEQAAKSAETTIEEFKKADQLPNHKALVRKIQALAKYKGISPRALQGMKFKITGKKSLTDMNITELQAVLSAVRSARPKKIQKKTVITVKTEQAIQALKATYIAMGKLNEETYRGILRYLRLPTDKYESMKRFIQEKEGRQLIRAINFEAQANIIGYFTKAQQGLENHPEIKEVIDEYKRLIEKSVPPPERIGAKQEGIEEVEKIKKASLNPLISMLQSLRRLQEQLGGRSVTIIYDVAVAIFHQRCLMPLLLERWFQELIAKVPEIKRVTENPESNRRVRQALLSDYKLENAPPYPKDITPEEERVYKALREFYDSEAPYVRFMRFLMAYYKFNGDPEKMKTGDDEIAIIDAPVKDLREAVRIYETQGERALKAYTDSKTWGTRQAYSPQDAVVARVVPYRRAPVRIGQGKLKQRHETTFEAVEDNELQRAIAHKRALLNLQLQPLFQKLDMEFQKIKERLKNPGRDAQLLSQWLTEIKGAYRPGVVAEFLLRLGGWTFGTLSLQPYFFMRNLFQNAVFHPDKEEFLKLAFTILHPRVRRGLFFQDPSPNAAERRLYFNHIVSQRKGMEQEQMMLGYLGRSPFERLLRMMSYYPFSDEINRLLSMTVSGTKAARALKQFRKDGDVRRFVETSGMAGLSKTDQIRILEMLAMDSYDYPEGTLKSVSGGEAAVREIARLITEQVHFNYVRWLRSAAEMGEGRITLSLFAFTRGFTELISRHFAGILDVFGKEPPRNSPPPGWNAPPGDEQPPLKWVNWARLKRHIKALASIFIGIGIMGAIWKKLWGRPNPYDPLHIWQWQFGGLALGSVIELQEVYRWLVIGIQANDEKTRERAIGEIEWRITRLGDMFIPLYVNLIATLEAIYDVEDIDKQFVSQLIDYLRGKYEPPTKEQEKVGRTFWQKIMYAVFTRKEPDPKPLEKALKELKPEWEKLGTFDEWKGRIYTTSDLSTAMRPYFKVGDDWLIAPDLINENEGFHPIARYWVETMPIIDAFYRMPETERENILILSPEILIWLYFWGKRTSLDSIKDEAKREWVKGNLENLAREFGIDRKAIPALARESAAPERSTQPPERLEETGPIDAERMIEQFRHLMEEQKREQK